MLQRPAPHFLSNRDRGSRARAMASTVALAGIAPSRNTALWTPTVVVHMSSSLPRLPGPAGRLIQASSQSSVPREYSRRALFSLLATAAPAVLYAKKALAGDPPLSSVAIGPVTGSMSSDNPEDTSPAELKYGKYDPLAKRPKITKGPSSARGSQYELTTYYDDWSLDEKTLKNIYLCFSLFFMWGCCVYGSMKDPFYDSDLYRDAGGDGSSNWLYRMEEEEEMKAREELWREELAREIEERVEELKELEEGEKERELV